MSVRVEDLKVGRVYEFPNGDRRIVEIKSTKYREIDTIIWEYADGQKRKNGRLGGSQWYSYFASNAKGIISEEK